MKSVEEVSFTRKSERVRGLFSWQGTPAKLVLLSDNRGLFEIAWVASSYPGSEVVGAFWRAPEREVCYSINGFHGCRTMFSFIKMYKLPKIARLTLPFLIPYLLIHSCSV